MRGHTNDCLVRNGEISECDPKDPVNCAGLCVDLVSRVNRDMATTKSFTVLSTQCHEANFEGSAYGTCTGIVVINGACYPATPNVEWDQMRSCPEDDAGP